jgi:hypothetical protein
VMMGNGSHTSIRGVGTIDLKITSGKIVQLRNMQHVNKGCRERSPHMEHGIIHERTPPYLLQSNGVAERKNRTLTDLVNSMLDTARLSKIWWGGFIDFMSSPKYNSYEE